MDGGPQGLVDLLLPPFLVEGEGCPVGQVLGDGPPGDAATDHGDRDAPAVHGHDVAGGVPTNRPDSVNVRLIGPFDGTYLPMAVP